MRTLLLSTLMSMPLAAAAADGGGVGYPTVAAALEALKSTSGATMSVQGGWTIVNDSASNAIWSFTPPDHPAYPAVVRRGLVQRDGGIHMEMTALCQASKAACGQLMEEFKQLNARMAQSMQPKPAPVQATPEQVQAVERQTKGFFAAVDGRQFANLDTHCGYLVWRTLDDGSFQLVREEQNVIDKATAQKIKPDELARLRTQFGCKEEAG